MDLSSISNVSVISGQDEDCRPPAAKRMRGATSTYAAPRTETKRENPFIPPQLDLGNVSRFVLRLDLTCCSAAKLVEFPKQTKKEVKMVQQAMVEQKRPTEAKDIAQSMSLSGSLGAPKPVPRLFTEEQVLKIVEDACRCRDEQTSQRFNEIHNEAMRGMLSRFVPRVMSPGLMLL